MATEQVGKTDRTIITVSGKSESVSKCRKIDNLYYFVGDFRKKDSGDCYLLPENEKYVRASNPKLHWNYTKERYVIISDEILGVIGLNNGVIETGYFNYSVYCPRIYVDGDVLYGIPDFKGFSSHFAYDPINMYYVIKREYDKRRTEIYLNEGHRKGQYKAFPGEYYSANETPHLPKVSASKKQFPSDPLDEYLKGRTLGVEIETRTGSVPEEQLYIHGMVPLKDGSISGHEYVSDIIKPSGAINLLRSFFEIAAQYTRVDQTCSLHYHIGGFNYKVPENVVALYTLWYRLQDETDSMMPPYKRDLQFLAGKKGGPKDHCARLPELNIFDRLGKGRDEDVIKVLYEEMLSIFNDNKGVPQKSGDLYRHVHHGRQKWDQHGRYYGINFIPLLFENKHTVEFRLHSGTVNQYKAIYWLLICLAMLKYAEEQHTNIFSTKNKLRLSDILEYCYKDNPAILETLLSYVMHRKDMNRRARLCADIYANEFTKDSSFTFK